VLSLQYFIADKELEWAKLDGMCADGPPSIMGIHSGYQAFVKQVSPMSHSPTVYFIDVLWPWRHSPLISSV
jgi:hypothetical protein